MAKLHNLLAGFVLDGVSTRNSRRDMANGFTSKMVMAVPAYIEATILVGDNLSVKVLLPPVMPLGGWGKLQAGVNSIIDSEYQAGLKRGKLIT